LACVISDIACHKEVYEDSVLYFDPYNVEDIAQKINEILTNENLKKEIVKKGFERTKIYNWTHTAEKTLEVFNQALEIEK
jgi:glycosyltransferase involved in cell wall biosynthesis